MSSFGVNSEKSFLANKLMVGKLSLKIFLAQNEKLEGSELLAKNSLLDCPSTSNRRTAKVSNMRDKSSGRCGPLNRVEAERHSLSGSSMSIVWRKEMCPGLLLLL